MSHSFNVKVTIDGLDTKSNINMKEALTELAFSFIRNDDGFTSYVYRLIESLVNDLHIKLELVDESK